MDMGTSRRNKGWSHLLILLLIPWTTYSAEDEVTTEDPGHASYTESDQTDEIEVFDDNYPTVNKCCPFNWSYENGKCVKSELSNKGKGQSIDFLEKEASFWEAAPKTIVTLVAKDFHAFNTTEIIGDPVIFRLSVGQPECSTKRIEITHNDLMSGADNLDSVLALSPSGYLLWSDEGSVHQVSSKDFCIDQYKSKSTEPSYVAVFCAPVCDEMHPCVRKCCNPEAILFNNTCMLSSKHWEPFLYEKPGQLIEPDPARLIHYKIGVPNCEYYSVSLRSESSEKVYLLLNGTLVLDSNGKKVYYEPNTFCLDGSLTTTSFDEASLELPDHVVHYSGQELDQTVILCYNPADELNGQEPEDWRLMLYACVTLISSFFLFLTALAFIALWEYQNIHGWLQFCYVLSLLFAFTFLAIVQLSSDSIQEISSVCCKMIGAFIHFLFLSAFFWLTSMNFDLFLTFSGCRPMRPNSVTGEKKRFLGFALFSYGLPCLIAGVGLVLDSLYRDNPYIITPRFGERYCYFYGDKEKLPYFYGPVGILLTINSVFFISTIYSLHKLQNDTKFATKQSSRQEKKRFFLFMKLFVVMGVLWIFEVISWATMMLNHKDQYIKNIFLPTDLLIGAQGIAIFIIFTCKPNTCRQLEAQLKKFSEYLQEKRDQSAMNPSFLKTGYIVSGFCVIIITIVNRLRCLLGLCCHVSRRLDGKRNMSQTNTITSTVWDKSKKVSDISGSTVIASMEMELDFTSSAIPRTNNKVDSDCTTIFKIP